MIGFYFGGLFVFLLWGHSEFKRGGYPEVLYVLWQVSPARLVLLLVLCFGLWPIYLPLTTAISFWILAREERNRLEIDKHRRCLGDEGCDGPVVPGTTKCALHHAADEFYE